MDFSVYIALPTTTTKANMKVLPTWLSMLNFLRLTAVPSVALLLSLALAITEGNAFRISPASATDMATLNAQMQKAVCVQNWGEAIKLVDKMIAITPSSNQMRRNELKTYRGRMQSLYDSKANLPGWSENCSARTGSAPAATNANLEGDRTTEQVLEQSNCSPAYPNTCIPEPEPDLDCGEISYRRFKVLPPDPHMFDSDGDGIGCEG